jgi:HlyD family secretion protein
MLIVPGDDRLTVEARIAPHDIDQVRIGQSAVVRFPAFNMRTTPELNGEVSRVMRITLPDHELVRLMRQTLVPGMPVESFIQTGERTVIAYLVKPMRDQIMRAFREK